MLNSRAVRKLVFENACAWQFLRRVAWSQHSLADSARPCHGEIRSNCGCLQRYQDQVYFGILVEIFIVKCQGMAAVFSNYLLNPQFSSDSPSSYGNRIPLKGLGKGTQPLS